jgi:hypothetical protein
MDLLERDRPLFVADHDGLPAQSLEPFDDILRVGNAAAQEEQLRFSWSKSHGQFVIQATVSVTKHLIFVDHKQRRPASPDQMILLGLECRDHDRGVEVFCQITCGNAHIPAARAPFSEFVVGQRSRRNRINGLATILALIGPELENQGLAGASRSLDHDITSLAQRRDRLLLPQVGDGDLVESGQIRQW